MLRAPSATLYDRLRARNYAEAKLQENMDAELMDVLLTEARDAFDPALVVELQSATTDDVDENVDRVVTWVENWRRDNAE